MDIVFRAITLFLFVWLVTRAVGRRELSTLQPFDLILLIVLGDLIQQGVTQNDFSLTGATLAISTFAFWGLVLSWLSYLSPRAAKVLEGEPRVIIRHGELLQHSTRRDRLTRSEIESEMRLAGISSMDEVSWAVLEPNGKMSFIKRAEGAEPSRQTDEQAAG